MKWLLCLLAITVLAGSALYGVSKKEKLFYENLVRIAEANLGKTYIPSKDGVYFTTDCIGTIRYFFWLAGKVELERFYIGSDYGACKLLWRGLSQAGYVFNSAIAKPGDIILFSNTWDYNGNGIWDDPYGHIGLVTKIGISNTMYFVHFASHKVKEDAMNLTYPHVFSVTTDKGETVVINNWLRRRGNEGYPDYCYYSSGFYSCFAHIPIGESDTGYTGENTTIQYDNYQTSSSSETVSSGGTTSIVHASSSSEGENSSLTTEIRYDSSSSAGNMQDSSQNKTNKVRRRGNAAADRLDGLINNVRTRD